MTLRGRGKATHQYQTNRRRANPLQFTTSTSRRLCHCVFLFLQHRPSSSSGCHYAKTSNRSCIICNGPLTPVTSTHICNGCCLAPITYSAPGRPGVWPPQRPLPMWTSGTGLLKRPLHKFFVTDVKESSLQMLNLSVTGL
jgi:hypothetical protein